MENCKFKVGQKWKTRGGNVVRIVEIEIDGGFPVEGDDEFFRDKEGFWLGSGIPDSADLVELVQDVSEPEGKPEPTDTPPPQAPKIGNAVDPEKRQQFIADVIVAGVTRSMPASDIREYINLYDSALG